MAPRSHKPGHRCSLVFGGRPSLTLASRNGATLRKEKSRHFHDRDQSGSAPPNGKRMRPWTHLSRLYILCMMPDLHLTDGPTTTRRRDLTLPAGFIPPCLPMMAPRPPSEPFWLHEIKYDGIRIIARKN